MVANDPKTLKFMKFGRCYTKFFDVAKQQQKVYFHLTSDAKLYQKVKSCTSCRTCDLHNICRDVMLNLDGPTLTRTQLSRALNKLQHQIDIKRWDFWTRLKSLNHHEWWWHQSSQSSLRVQVAAEKEQAAHGMVWHFNKGFQSLTEQIFCYCPEHGCHVNWKKPKRNWGFWGWHFLTSNLIGFWDGGVGREAPFSWKGLEEVRREPKTKSVSPFLKPPPFRIRLDMSDHAGRQRQAQTGVTAGQLTWDFCGQRHRARRNMMCTDNLQCSCRIEHQWRSGGLWLDTAKYEIFTKAHLTKTHLNKTRWQSRQRWSPSPIREPTCTITGLWVSVWCALVCKLCNV